MSSSAADRPENPRRPSNLSGRSKAEGPPSVQRFPRYHVILLSDPSQDLMFVVRSVMQLTRFPREEATYKMWQAHHGGRAILLTTFYDRAELFVEQFREKGLTVAIEPA